MQDFDDGIPDPVRRDVRQRSKNQFTGAFFPQPLAAAVRKNGKFLNALVNRIDRS
jgi:hypothetical protein